MWLPSLPLHTILTLLSQLPPSLASIDASSTSQVPSATVLASIEGFVPASIDPSAIRIQTFEWTPLSLGWYESLLWSFIFVSELAVQKGTVGVWNGTQVKLFRVQEVQERGPSLSSPRGAVDAVGSNIVRRMGGLGFATTVPGSATATATAAATVPREGGTSVRSAVV